MIRIGLGPREKQKEVDAYIKDHGIKQVFCFYFKKFPAKFKADQPIEYYEYKDIIEYKPFYHLLEVINPDTLLIFDECMRTQKRSDLTYNCAHHYCNQTPHKIIFEYFPIIESKADFMILLDFENKGKYKGKGFDYVYLQEEDIKIKPVKISLEIIPVETTSSDLERYEKKKEQLFATLGEKDPDTVPRTLQLFAGDLKKKAIKPDKLYVARNKRFKLDNVFSYDELIGKAAADNYIVVDTHYRRLDFNDYLKTIKATKIKYLCTTLPIDNVIITEFAKWEGRLKSIYAQASLYK